MRDRRPAFLWLLPLALAALAAVVVAPQMRRRASTGAAAPSPRFSNERGEGAASPVNRSNPRPTFTTVAEPDLRARWRELAGEPPSIARDAELADRLEQLAEADPDEAATVLLALTETDRRRVVAAVLLDAARAPATAAELADQFCRADPAGAMDHGYSLVATLTRAGEFDAALRFVELQGAVGESEHPSKWLREIFAAWAQQSPAAAATRAAALPGEGLREEALIALAGNGQQ